MTGKEIQGLFERLARLVSASERKEGAGMSWEYTFPDGETHRYVVRGLKSHAEAEDEVSNLLIWIWNAKDWLKLRAEAKGGKRGQVEAEVNKNSDLLMCGDLANLLKHGRLNQSRTGQFPRFGKMAFRAPQTSIGAITVLAFEVQFDFDNPSEVEFEMPVLDREGRVLGDTFDFARKGITALERIRDDLLGAV